VIRDAYLPSQELLAGLKVSNLEMSPLSSGLEDMTLVIGEYLIVEIWAEMAAVAKGDAGICFFCFRDKYQVRAGTSCDKAVCDRSFGIALRSLRR